MRISTITNCAYSATLLLTAVSGGAFILSTRAATDERAAIERHLALDELGEALALASEVRSDEARLYAMRGAPRHLAAFHRAERSAAAREALLRRLQAHGLPSAERRALDEVATNLDELDRIERAAVARAAAGDRESAAAMLFGADHERAQTAVLEPVRRFRELVGLRTRNQVDQAQAKSDRYAQTARIMLGLTAALFLAVLYFVLRRRVVLPLGRMTGIITRLARQDYAVEVPHDPRRDEIGDMNQAIHVFRENGLVRDRLEAERAADQRIKDAILQMMHRLQAVQNETELAEIVARFAPQTFPALAGHLYAVNPSRTALVRIGSWCDPVNGCAHFPPTACWALRRGRPHLSNGQDGDVPCLHAAEQAEPAICVPLSAQGDMIGVLYFEGKADGADGGAIAEPARVYLELVAENIALALANLRLREQLTGLAVRDALTGLLNRRCLDETLNHRTRDRDRRPIACLMIDIDHFKRFNDVHGHDAGDVVMQHVAGMMTDIVGEAGQIFRFGGEEFTILLPGCDEACAMGHAERLRTAIAATPLAHRGRVLGHVTVSIGLAAAPEDGSIQNLVPRADAALLEAKASGRNQAVRASALADRAISAA